MKKWKLLLIGSCLILMLACQSNENQSGDANKKVEKISENLTDPNIIADQVMDAMGGQVKWQELKYVSWTFFGRRHLVWDKLGQRVRIESPGDSSIYLFDMKTQTGQFKQGNHEITENAVLTKKFEQAKSMWINDMYWLFMPFKLKDEGVHLKYVRNEQLKNGGMSQVLALTFDNVGLTPGNKYEVYVDVNDNLIKRWDFFKDASQDSLSASWAWDNYQDFKGLKLSAERSDSTGPSNVRVYDHLDDEVFTTTKSFDFY